MKYVIVGGDAAGMSAAMQLLKHDLQAEITILERGEIYSYAQCGMPYVVSGIISSVDDLVVRSVDTFREKFGMDARIYHDVKAVDTNSKKVSGINLETNEPFEVTYDKLLIATGATAFIPKWAEGKLKGVHTIKSLPETTEIIKDIEAGVNHVTVVGGGYIGLEMVESFVMLGKQVSLLIRGRRLAKMFDEDMAALIEAEASRHNVEICYEEEIEEIIGNKTVSSVRTNKRTLQTDMVIVATGVRPNTAYLVGTGIKLAENGGVEVNEYMRTNLVDVYAAGDCALQYHRITKKHDHIPLGTHANKQGRIAGLNMSGNERKFEGVLGTSILRFMDLTLAKTGLSDEEAKEFQLPFKSVVVTAKSHAGYYPGARTIWLKITFNIRNGRLLGAQVIGEKGVDKRIDVIATALFNEMTVLGLEDLDLSYAPPYNSTWDPVQQAARKAVSIMKE